MRKEATNRPYVKKYDEDGKVIEPDYVYHNGKKYVILNDGSNRQNRKFFIF